MDVSYWMFFYVRFAAPTLDPTPDPTPRLRLLRKAFSGGRSLCRRTRQHKAVSSLLSV